MNTFQPNALARDHLVQNLRRHDAQAADSTPLFLARSGHARVSVIIPALNEAENLQYVLPRIPDWVYEVLLIDGDSTDDTVEVARNLRPDIRIVQQQGRGKGAALRTGFAAATGEILVMLDADGSNPQRVPLPGYQQAPAWRGDGAVITFTSRPALGQPWQIWTMNSDGTHPRQQTPDNFTGGYRPMWLRRD